MNFTKLLNKTATLLTATKTTNAIGEETQEYVTVEGLYRTRYEKIGNTKVIENGYTTNLDDYLFFFNAGVELNRNDLIRCDSFEFDIKEINKVGGTQSVHHIEVIAVQRDHD